MKQKKITVKRFIMAASGTSICAACVGILNVAAFGVDPFQCFSMGVYIPFQKMGMSYGMFWPVVSALFLVAVFLLDKHYIGFGTVVNLAVSGYIIEWVETGLTYILTDSPAMWIRVILLIITLFLISAGASIYFVADLGVSAYDGIALAVSDKKPKLFGRVIPFRIMRIITDIGCVIVGFLFGKMPGVGTILTAFFMGPLIDWFNRHLSRPLLYGKES